MNEQAAPTELNNQSVQKPRAARRVGTVTVGLIFIISGICMVIAMFFPRADFRILLQLSPLALVSFGIEILVSHAIYKDGNYKYDWVSVLLSFFVVAATLSLFWVAWEYLYGMTVVCY